MNTKLIEKIKRSAIKGRLGDFICNFIAVVLGIAITFVGSDMIQEHNKKKEVAQALQLVKSELLINRETIEEMMKIEKINKEGACYLLQYKDKMNEASSDSLNYYGYFHSNHKIFFRSPMLWKCSELLLSCKILKTKSFLSKSSRPMP